MGCFSIYDAGTASGSKGTGILKLIRNRQRIKCVREGIDNDKVKDRRPYVKLPR